MPSAFSADPLPNTHPLTEKGDLARKMVDGIHAYLDRELAAAPTKRDGVKPDRQRLRKLLGVVDDRVPPLEYVGSVTTGFSAGAFRVGDCTVHRVRWAVLPGVWAEGLHIYPTGQLTARVVASPHAEQSPEQAVGYLPGGDAFAYRLALAGCEVLIPTVIDRADTLSGNPRIGRQTNLPHREFVHRMSYEMGRTLTGYEVQTVLAAAGVLTFDRKSSAPLGVIGYGDGGRIALYAAALDERFRVCQVAGAFGPREGVWREPIDRNVWGLLTEFGDAEVGSLIAPRKLIVDTTPGPTWAGPAAPKPGRGGAAPGSLTPMTDADVGREFDRLKKRAGDAATKVSAKEGRVNTEAFLAAVGVKQPIKSDAAPGPGPLASIQGLRDLATERHHQQFDQLVAYTQKLWRDSDTVRKKFWAKADPSTPEKWEQTSEPYRRYFHEEVIGKLPDPTIPLNPRTRPLYDEPKWAGHEVMLDVYPDVFAYGILLLPKDIKPGEQRPVVVCQHGLEGRPTDVTNPKERTKYYNSFGAQLADRGYVVYAPQNPYIGQTHFRQIQRKAQPLKASLFSFIVRQHQRTLDWLETLPQVDPKRIAFYGLSYGGKTAMRVPAIETRYALSICSADFNEWIGKNVSVDFPGSYMWTVEYDMYEFDLGHTFNYAEMAYLIAPRPFMVERGHDDGVGIDEMVAYEYAKIRYLYANKLKLPDRTAIEFFPGGHEINGKGTFAFLQKHLGWPK